MIQSIVEFFNRILDFFEKKEDKKAKEFEIKNTAVEKKKEEARIEVKIKDANEKLVADLATATPEKKKLILDEIRRKVS